MGFHPLCHRLLGALGHGTPTGSCAGGQGWGRGGGDSEPRAVGHGQGSLLSSRHGHRPSTPPCTLPGWGQTISASLARPSDLPISSIAHPWICIPPPTPPQPPTAPRAPVL